MKLAAKIKHKGLLLVLVPLMFELLFVSVLWIAERQAEEALLHEIRSRQLVTEVQDLILYVYRSGESFVKFSFDRSDASASEVEATLRQVPDRK